MVQDIDCPPVTDDFIMPAVVSIEMAEDVLWGRMENRVDMYQLPPDLQLNESLPLPSQVKKFSENGWNLEDDIYIQSFLFFS